MGDKMNEIIKSSGTKIIAIEGIDGSGKTLQTKMLYRKLLQLGYKVALRSYPVYSSFLGSTLFASTLFLPDKSSPTCCPKKLL